MITIDDLVKQHRLGDVFILARYMYRIGEPFLEDFMYDRLEDTLRSKYFVEYKEYLCRSYDDDPIPVTLLQELGIMTVTPTSDVNYKALEEDKSNSIRPVRSWEDAYQFMMSNKGREMVMSVKLDGVNGKSLYLDGKLAVCLSRGRKGNSIDYTKGASMIMPTKLPIGSVYLPSQKIVGEYFASVDSLEKLRTKYNSSKYKTAKSSAISMLRVEHEPEDYSYLNFRAFFADGDYAHVTDMYEALNIMGFKTPPYLVITDFPDNKEEFRDWLLSEPMKQLEEESQGLPSDGIVLEVNDLHSDFKEEHQYSERQIALKFGRWDFGYEKGVITGINIEQKRVMKSVRIAIAPMLTRDGCNATYINSFNPSILIKNDLYVGKEVYFEKNSGAVNILIHGKRMQDIIQNEKEEAGGYS